MPASKPVCEAEVAPLLQEYWYAGNPPIAETEADPLLPPLQEILAPEQEALTGFAEIIATDEKVVQMPLCINTR